MRHLILVSAAIALSGCVPTFEASHTTSAQPRVTAFQEIATPFTHVWTEPSHPFTGAAVIDVDGDGAFEIFVGGGLGQPDMLLAYVDGRLVDRIPGTGLSIADAATYGAASSDLDGDGDVDLAVVRDDGLSLYINNAGRFERRVVPITLDADAVALSVSLADIDGDGDADVYVSAFVTFPAFKSATFNVPSHAKKNIMLRNDGNLTFTDVTAVTGTAGLNNTFHTTFADLDGDRDQDMILSQNTGEVEILENTGDGTFKNIGLKTGYGFWMGLAVGDIDADGDPDIFVSNIGTSIPDFLTSGDLKYDQPHETRWALLRNDGNLKFSNTAQAMNLHGYGFAWGAQFEDLNLDGETDLLVAQNYIKWPLHKWGKLPGKALIQLDAPEARGFYQVSGIGLDNPHYGQSPIIVDLDGDGRADVVWLNMAGPLRALLNRSSGHYLTVRLADDVRTQGATVRLTFADGRTRSRQVIASTGLMTDPTPDVHFGLGDQVAVSRIEVERPDGTRVVVTNPQIDAIVSIGF